MNRTETRTLIGLAATTILAISNASVLLLWIAQGASSGKRILILVLQLFVIGLAVASALHLRSSRPFPLFAVPKLLGAYGPLLIGAISFYLVERGVASSLDPIVRLFLLFGMLVALILFAGIYLDWSLGSSGSNITVAIASLCASLFIIEIAATFHYAQKPEVKKSVSSKTSIRMEPPLENLPVRYAPNNTWYDVYESDPYGTLGDGNKVEYRIGDLGCRDLSLEVLNGREDRYKILMLGDSFTFGQGVSSEDTLPSQLEEALNAALRSLGPRSRLVEVVNCGHGGYDTRDELNVYKYVSETMRHDLVILQFFKNDWRGTYNRTCPHGRCPRNTRLSRLLYILPWLREIQVSRVEGDGSRISDFQESFGTIVAMKELVESNDAAFAAFIYPAFGEAPEADQWLHSAFDEFLSAHRVRHFDLADAFRQAQRPVEQLVVHPGDWHPNKLANRIAARALSDWLLTEGGY